MNEKLKTLTPGLECSLTSGYTLYGKAGFISFIFIQDLLFSGFINWPGIRRGCGNGQCDRAIYEVKFAVGLNCAFCVGIDGIYSSS